MVVLVVAVATSIVVAIAIPVPAMIVLYTPAISLPISRKELFTIMVRSHPSSALIGRA